MTPLLSSFAALLLAVLLQDHHARAFVPTPFPSLAAARAINRASTTTLTSSIADAPADSSLDEEEKEEGSFDWFKAWYPIVPVEILDKEKPHKFQLLGEDIVVWNDGSVGEFGPKDKKKKSKNERDGTWRAFVDSCPHRKVPLSEGRVENDGTLLCSYHAWRFDGEGKCVEVPQALSQKEKESIINSPRANCNAYPTKVINGVLFVWPSSDENAVLESELTPVVHRPAVDGGDRLFEGNWNYRELPYGSDFFLENVVDVAHVTVSHHNVVGSRYMNQQMKLDIASPLTKDGFTMTETRSSSSSLSSFPSTISFHAPSLVAIDAVFENGASQTLELYTSPSRPGFCNHVGRMVIMKDENGKMPNLLRAFTFPLPKWLNHVLTSAFLHQDALFLHHQERHMAQTRQYKTYREDEDEEEKPYDYNKAVYAAQTDKGVITFRNWMRKFAGGRIPYRNNPTMSAASNDVVFDVWNAHTKHCKYCQDALRNLKRARFTTLLVSACLAVVRPFASIWANLFSTLAMAGVGLVINKLIGMFYKYEFSHATND